MVLPKVTLDLLALVEPSKITLALSFVSYMEPSVMTSIMQQNF
jgi:hypothetical protein